MVADAHLAVCPAISAERARGLGRGRGGNDVGCGRGHVVGVGVLEVIGARAVVRVNVLARRDVCRGDADVLAVLHDLLAALDVGAGNLVEQRDVLGRDDMALAATGQRVGDVGAGLELVDGDDDVVLLVNDDAVSHERSSLGLGRLATRRARHGRLAPVGVALVPFVRVCEPRSQIATVR